LTATQSAVLDQVAVRRLGGRTEPGSSRMGDLLPRVSRPPALTRSTIDTSHSSAFDAELLSAFGREIRRVLDDIDLPAYLVDLAGTLVWANVAADALVGARVGGPFSDGLPPDLRETVLKEFARKALLDSATNFDLCLQDGSGHRHTFRVRSAPLRRYDRIIGVFGLAVPLRESNPLSSAEQPLTRRQTEVLHLLSQGCTTNAIAARLGVSIETARNHIRALFQRLDVHSRLEAVVEGNRRGLIRDAEIP
jgi:DNA-binding CsgD family transcriptional regulator/PAS domain-containing protein